MNWFKGNISDILFVSMAAVYFVLRDKSAEFTQIADVLVIGVLLIITAKYFMSGNTKGK